MQYTSELKRLVLPEYGRNVQQMVDHCMTIEDRAERTRCANTIINIMGNLFPHLRDIEDFKHKLWDHLAIMSDFKLDIDYPYEIIKKEEKTAILVTHDLSEAISVADQILVLTSRPGQIQKEVPIHFSMEKRTPMQTRSAPEFQEYFNLIWKELNTHA